METAENLIHRGPLVEERRNMKKKLLPLLVVLLVCVLTLLAVGCGQQGPEGQPGLAGGACEYLGSKRQRVAARRQVGTHNRVEQDHVLDVAQ